MHHKRLFIGFLLGLIVGAYYHYLHKDTPKEQDGLYKLVVRVRGKAAEARDPNSDLHATIDNAANKVKNVADDAASKAKDVASQAGDKVKATVSKTQAKAEDVADDAAAKVKQSADSVAKTAEEKVA